MPFSDAIAALSNDMAAKRPAWGGYVFRKDDEQIEGAYDLVFVPRSGAADSKTYHFGADGVVTVESPETLDAVLLVGMMADDWIVGDKADFETARSGSGRY